MVNEALLRHKCWLRHAFNTVLRWQLRFANIRHIDAVWICVLEKTMLNLTKFHPVYLVAFSPRLIRNHFRVTMCYDLFVLGQDVSAESLQRHCRGGVRPRVARLDEWVWNSDSLRYCVIWTWISWIGLLYCIIYYYMHFHSFFLFFVDRQIGIMLQKKLHEAFLVQPMV